MIRSESINLAFPLDGNREALEFYCARNDVLMICEAKRREEILDLAAILPDGWATTQDASSADRCGSAICWNTETLEVAQRGLIFGSGKAPGVLTRWIAWANVVELATGGRIRFVAAHAPLPKTGKQPEFFRNLQALVDASSLPVVVGVDFNRDHTRVAADLGLKSIGAGIMGNLHDPRLIDLNSGVSRLGIARRWTDHPTVRATYAFSQESPMARGFYPKAVQKIIPAGDNDPPITPRIAILHVDAGNAESLHDYFATRSGGIESHFHVRKDGVVEQYRNIFRQADANLNANDFAVSIETQGLGAGTWNDAQLTAIKQLLLWLNHEAGVPLERCARWDGTGVGYHVMFGAPGPWTPVAKSCPGPDRIKQFETVLVPWMKRRTAPTRVEKARALLGSALATAVEKGHTKRAGAIKAALDVLPRR